VLGAGPRAVLPPHQGAAPKQLAFPRPPCFEYPGWCRCRCRCWWPRPPRRLSTRGTAPVDPRQELLQAAVVAMRAAAVRRAKEMCIIWLETGRCRGECKRRHSMDEFPGGKVELAALLRGNVCGRCLTGHGPICDPRVGPHRHITAAGLADLAEEELRRPPPAPAPAPGRAARLSPPPRPAPALGAAPACRAPRRGCTWAGLWFVNIKPGGARRVDRRRSP